MSDTNTADLSIKGESIQSLYSYYLSKTFLVNRRYQRKLVWTIDEKRSFIDSIMKGYPVPLVLLAEKNEAAGRKLEIIDGMQRLNALMSFIEQEFDVNGSYFDLDTMADTKLLKDEEKIEQKEPLLSRELCARIVRYQVPLSVFLQTGNSHVDEVFRRLNSNGRHLSKQELRQAGSLSNFASIVRKLSSNIRGDSSASDVLNLNAMKEISITNKSLDYGVNVDDIFWVKNNIITKDYLRESRDEEILADIVAWISIGKGVRSSSDILDQLYGFTDDTLSTKESSLASQIELEIQKKGDEEILANVQFVLDELIGVLIKANKTFNALLFERQQPKIARYFQIVFLAFYQLLIEENKEICDLVGLIKKMDKAGDKVINLSAGGGNWSAKEKQTAIDSFVGVIKRCFKKSKENDPGKNQWVTRLENLLMQSSTEQTLYDFKTGFHALEAKATFDKALFSKVIKTLTAMANTLPGATGYCVVGIADTRASATRHKKIYGTESISYSTFYVNGVDGEAIKYHKDVDTYFTTLTNLVKNEPISERDKDYISRNISTVRYFDKTVIIFKIESDNKPSIYGNQYFVRHGSNLAEITPENFASLFSRF
ncbi:GmrSD restriction endonuclease domain-containing protein [Serratia marcescens]|uniref:GmrSD restriction endonuclease domain-containing protein n=2 Tax=Serratia marcescens TaxID=615 RepID=UPI001A1DC4C8|nr:DUF262 domain-containing protein [Serratia marcescens]WLS20467.1 DUF262 domain-containing protein [Serratia marcescens]HAU5722128.1 DUF262 domain-containing protein [Serratia marcescens]HAU5742218.1 DUF262 domain-containing protein [Serratia marcescens]HAU5747897.1 DUF262 domain-containing protein [Serratia marcescens]HAU5758512.1 DUF262 domain-containing protein [Serratia marcescens]